MKEDLIIYKELFYGEYLELQSYSKHRNHFDVNFKQTCSEKNSSDFHRYVFIRVETFFMEMGSGVLLIKKVQTLIWGF